MMFFKHGKLGFIVVNTITMQCSFRSTVMNALDTLLYLCKDPINAAIVPIGDDNASFSQAEQAYGPLCVQYVDLLERLADS